MNPASLRILILQNKVLDYRVPLYKVLKGQYPNIEIGHSGKRNKSLADIEVKQIIFEPRIIKGFVFIDKLFRLANDYDVIIGMFDLRWVSIWKLVLTRKRKFRFYFWGIGVSTENGFDFSDQFSLVRYYLAKKADGIIFYSTYPVRKYIRGGVPAEKIYVANNTVYCMEKINLEDRKYNKYVFIGSLSKRKKLKILIDQFIKFINFTNSGIKLEIAGDGEMKGELEEYIQEIGFQDHIKFIGHIQSFEEKKAFFSDAIATVSIGQAGLSVLESFSFGVPFITQKDSITGGERLNIKTWENGILLNKAEELHLVMRILVEDVQLREKLSFNCFHYYWEYRKIEDMASGFIEAIESVT